MLVPQRSSLFDLERAIHSSPKHVKLKCLGEFVFSFKHFTLPFDTVNILRFDKPEAENRCFVH